MANERGTVHREASPLARVSEGCRVNVVTFSWWWARLVGPLERGATEGASPLARRPAASESRHVRVSLLESAS